MSHSMSGFAVLALLLFFSASSCEQQTEKTTTRNVVPESHQSREIPQVVVDGLKTRFPQAEIQKWTREREGDIVVYDFEFTQGGMKLEADIKADGSIHNWEKAIDLGDLPEMVGQAAETKYPQSTIKEIMEITALIDGQETLEAYEIVLETADMKNVEIAVAPDGRILEDSEETAPEHE